MRDTVTDCRSASEKHSCTHSDSVMVDQSFPNARLIRPSVMLCLCHSLREGPKIELCGSLLHCPKSIPKSMRSWDYIFVLKVSFYSCYYTKFCNICMENISTNIIFGTIISLVFILYSFSFFTFFIAIFFEGTLFIAIIFLSKKSYKLF